MIWLILCCIVAILITLHLIEDARDRYWYRHNFGYLWRVFWLIPLGVGAYLASAFIGLLSGIFFEYQDWQPYSETPLAVVYDSQGISGGVSGGLFVVSGYVNSELVFNVYEKTGDNEYRPKSYKGSECLIREEDRKDAKIVQFYRELGTEKQRYWWTLGVPGQYSARYIYVPKGTVRTGFSLGMPTSQAVEK